MPKTKKKEQRSKKIRRGDQVIVIAGNYKGQKGEVLHVEDARITVEGVNLCKKHVRPTQENPKGGIVSFEKPIHVSNVKLCVNDKGVKLCMEKDEQGRRTLSYKENGKLVSYRNIKDSPK